MLVMYITASTTPHQPCNRDHSTAPALPAPSLVVSTRCQRNLVLAIGGAHAKGGGVSL